MLAKRGGLSATFRIAAISIVRQTVAVSPSTRLSGISHSRSSLAGKTVTSSSCRLPPILRSGSVPLPIVGLSSICQMPISTNVEG